MGEYSVQFPTQSGIFVLIDQKKSSNMSVKEIMKEVLFLEAEALKLASERLSTDELAPLGPLLKDLHKRGGNLVFCGVGKSGLIGQKLAATFMSLGLSSYFLHPTEALHGDLGRVKSDDVIVLLSKSGTTEEIVKILPFLPMDKSKKMALVGNTSSIIASACDIIFDCSVEKEACLNNQAPTTSSTLTLAMGDAMAVVFEKEVGLSKEGFAQNHPGGLLGKSLRLLVKDLMTEANMCPILLGTNTLKDALVAMTDRPVGGLAILDDQGIFKGLIVDGDVRRSLAKDEIDLKGTVDQMMNKTPTSITSSDLAINGLKLMEEGKRSISILPVIEEGKFLGFLRLHDLVKEGFK
jgi:arabinose-5-phosphate isomerase